MSEQLEKFEFDLSGVLYWMNGNGTPGRKVRLDRLEVANQLREREQERHWQLMMTLICGGGVTLVLEVVNFFRSVR